jgi:hypothetical protein
MARCGVFAVVGHVVQDTLVKCVTSSHRDVDGDADGHWILHGEDDLNEAAGGDDAGEAAHHDDDDAHKRSRGQSWKGTFGVVVVVADVVGNHDEEGRVEDDDADEREYGESETKYCWSLAAATDEPEVTEEAAHHNDDAEGTSSDQSSREVNDLIIT